VPDFSFAQRPIIALFLTFLPSFEPCNLFSILTSVDPLDGTNNYARGQFDSVSILVAIILDNTPCFGVICKPFGQDTATTAEGISDVDGDVTAAAAALATVSLSEAAAGAPPPSPLTSPTRSAAAATKKMASNPNCSYAVYGGTLLKGVFVAGQDDAVSPSLSSRSTVPQSDNYNSTDDTSLPRAIISSSRSGGIVKRICVALHEEGVLHPDMVLVSGAGEKALRLVVGTQQEGLWPFPRPGTSLWDVAAADALLLQQGGRLTDSMGRPMNYAAAAFEEGTTDNDSGIFASHSAELHETCVKVFQAIQEQDAKDSPPAP
jgi:3'-phosphoadenosine 5'-phosphosulfate (PAPS) 3'-phosphatase